MRLLIKLRVPLHTWRQWILWAYGFLCLSIGWLVVLCFVHSKRVGWIPLDEELPPKLLSNYRLVFGLSVTEMEIVHAAYRIENPNGMYLYCAVPQASLGDNYGFEMLAHSYSYPRLLSVDDQSTPLTSRLSWRQYDHSHANHPSFGEILQLVRSNPAIPSRIYEILLSLAVAE